MKACVAPDEVAVGQVSSVTVCFPFAGGLIGGSHVSAVKLIKALNRRYFKPLVVLHSVDGPFADYLRRQGVRFEVAPPTAILVPRRSRFRQAAAALRPALRLARFLRQRGVGIVHTNDGAMHATWALPTRLAGAKLLWHHRGNPDAAGLRYLAPLLASRVVAVSNYAAPRPGLLSAAGKCSVVHSPFEVAASGAAATLDELSLPTDARILGFFGVLVDRKRPLTFVEAVAAAIARAPDLPIVGLIFGDVWDAGLDAAVIQRARALGIADRIHLMGFRAPPEPWLGLCELLIVPAVEEPFGRTLIEAMMLGVPVVAAASGGNIEAIRHGQTGVLVSPDDAPAFATAIVDLLRAPDVARAMAARARREALARFTVAAHVRSISTIYRELAA